MNIANEVSPSEKAIYCVIPIKWYSGKGKTYGVGKNISGGQDFSGRRVHHIIGEFF